MRNNQGGVCGQWWEEGLGGVIDSSREQPGEPCKLGTGRGTEGMLGWWSEFCKRAG